MWPQYTISQYICRIDVKPLTLVTKCKTPTIPVGFEPATLGLQLHTVICANHIYMYVQEADTAEMFLFNILSRLLFKLL